MADKNFDFRCKFCWSKVVYKNKLFWHLSSLEISSFDGNQWLLPFEVASLTMVSDILRPLYATLTFAQNNHGYHYRDRGK